jgi:hypothetical protein
MLLAVITALTHARAPGLLGDSDTREILSQIRERSDPWSWFFGDWPLANHFYRPVSTLTFEIDNALYGGAAWGYGLTNALLGSACILLLFWLVRELTSSPWQSAAASSLFGVWHLTGGGTPGAWLISAAGWLSLIGLFRGGSRTLAASSFLTAQWLASEFGAMFHLRPQVLDWIPGRTASVMAVFCLASMASYARFERIGAPRRAAPAAGAEDRPPTRSTDPREGERRPAWPWLILALAGLALALGSYEQAVMLPALLLAVAVWMAVKGRKPRWALHLGFWGMLAGYIALRAAILPREASGYQSQQFRDGPGVGLDIAAYLFPAAGQWIPIRVSLESLPFSLLTEGIYAAVAIAGGSLLFWGLAWKSRRFWLILGACLMSGLAFLPMAWLKGFGHYHYWPNALRALFLMMAAQAALSAALSAASPRAIRAPKRQRPASGSLPHPSGSDPDSSTEG